MSDNIIVFDNIPRLKDGRIMYIKQSNLFSIPNEGTIFIYKKGSIVEEIHYNSIYKYSPFIPGPSQWIQINDSNSPIVVQLLIVSGEVLKVCIRVLKTLTEKKEHTSLIDI